MEIIRHKQTTQDLAPPTDWDHQANGICNSLPVVDVVENNLNYMVSFWKPSQAELDLLNKGHAIALFVQCSDPDKHPVVAVTASADTIQNILE